MSGAWNNLTIREKAGFIKIGVDNGLTSLSDIQSAYNKFAKGGRLYDGETEDSQQMNITKSPQGYIYKINDEYSLDDDTYNALVNGKYLDLLKNENIKGLKSDLRALKDLANRRKNPVIFDIDPDSRYGPVLLNMSEDERNRITQSYLNSALNMMRYAALADPNIDTAHYSLSEIQELKDSPYYNYEMPTLYAGLPQATYLMSPQDQYTLFMDQGWKYLGKGQYNLVKKAAKRHKKYGKEGLPTYQMQENFYNRDDVMPIANIYDYDVNEYLAGKDELPDPGSFPGTLYYNGNTGIFAVKGEDLNDYGGDYGILSRLNILGNRLDKEGSPVVVTTGIQPVKGKRTLEDVITFNSSPTNQFMLQALDNALAERGLHREKINGKWQFVIPDVVVTPNIKVR